MPSKYRPAAPWDVKTVHQCCGLCNLTGMRSIFCEEFEHKHLLPDYPWRSTGWMTGRWSTVHGYKTIGAFKRRMDLAHTSRIRLSNWSSDISDYAIKSRERIPREGKSLSQTSCYSYKFSPTWPCTASFCVSPFTCPWRPGRAIYD